MSGEDAFVVLVKTVLVVFAIAFAVLILAGLAECFFRQSEIVEMEFLEVSSGIVVGEDKLPRFAGRADNTQGQVCVSERVHVLRKSGGIFGWFPTWYLIETVED